jgi:hypothetical protein
MLHFEVEKTNLWWVFFFKFLKSQFLFFSDIPEFQVGGPVNQQIKNMWPYSLLNVQAYFPVSTVSLDLSVRLVVTMHRLVFG